VHAVQSSVLERAVAPLAREFPAVRARLRGASPVDRAADAAKADFIWFLGAGAQRTDKPYMTVVWDLQHRATPWFPEMAEQGTWDRRELWHSWFLRRATVIITGTEFGRDEIDRYYQVGPERVAILPHPTPQFALDAAPGLDAATLNGLGLGQRPFLLYPAQFWPHKNHVNLLMALERLKAVHGLDLDLALVGSDKGNRAVVERTALRLGLTDRIRFLGFVSRPVLIQLYRQAAALAYMSWCGPENLPPLEAFALGCPVVASRIPGASEQLGDAAMLADPGDPAALADAISRVLTDTGVREDLIAKGHARAKAWTSRNYVEGALNRIDSLAPVVRCWREDGA
jgi:glycosyltransferase involved in cell wall biosynthesis